MTQSNKVRSAISARRRLCHIEQRCWEWNEDGCGGGGEGGRRGHINKRILELVFTEQEGTKDGSLRFNEEDYDTSRRGIEVLTTVVIQSILNLNTM